MTRLKRRNDAPRLIDAPFIECRQGGVEQVAVCALLGNLWDAARETHAVTLVSAVSSTGAPHQGETMATLLSQLLPGAVPTLAVPCGRLAGGGDVHGAVAAIIISDDCESVMV